MCIRDSAYPALVMEGELAEAIARDEFVLHFQPQVRAADGALVGVEALLRLSLIHISEPTRPY